MCKDGKNDQLTSDLRLSLSSCSNSSTLLCFETTTLALKGTLYVAKCDYRSLDVLVLLWNLRLLFIFLFSPNPPAPSTSLLLSSWPFHPVVAQFLATRAREFWGFQPRVNWRQQSPAAGRKNSLFSPGLAMRIQLSHSQAPCNNWHGGICQSKNS